MEHHAGEARQVAIVGLNRETANLLPLLLDAEGIQIIKVLNPDFEDPSRLTQFPHLNVIIDTTNNPSIASRLRKLPLKKVDVISGLGARILFCGIRKGSAVEKDGVLRCMEEIREAAGLNKNRSEILKVILNTALKSAGADCGSLMMLDPARRHLTIEASVGLEDNIVMATVQKVGKGISGNAIRRGEAILTQGPADKAAYSSDYQKMDLVSSICCPLMYGDEAVGVINIASRNPERVFGAADVEFLEELARLSAEVIRNSRDLESVQHPTHSLGLLNSAREILAMKYRFEERLNMLVMKLANSFGAKVCTYYEFVPADRTFLAKASSTAGLGTLKEKPLRLEEFFAQRILKTANTVCVNATDKAPRGKKWYMLQPIRSGNELAGALFICMHSEKNQIKEETALLKKVGDMLTRELFKNREMESIKVQSLKFSAISQFAFDIANARTLPELATMILSNVRLILEAETGILRLRNSPAERLEVCDAISHRDPEHLAQIVAADGNIAAEILHGKVPIRIARLSDSRFSHESRSSESVLAMGIDIGGELLGTISLYEKKSQDAASGITFSEQDKELLLNFCQQAGKGLKRFYPFPAPVTASREKELAG